MLTEILAIHMFLKEQLFIMETSIINIALGNTPIQVNKEETELLKNQIEYLKKENDNKNTILQILVENQWALENQYRPELFMTVAVWKLKKKLPTQNRYATLHDVNEIHGSVNGESEYSDESDIVLKKMKIEQCHQPHNPLAIKKKNQKVILKRTIQTTKK